MATEKTTTEFSAPAIIQSAEQMANLTNFVNMMSKGTVTVPDHLRGKPGDCFAVTLQAMQWGMNPFAVAQKTYALGGKLSYEAQLIVAALNTSGVLQKRLAYDFFGDWTKTTKTEKRQSKNGIGTYLVKAWSDADEDGLGVKVYGTLVGETTPRELMVFLKQATTRNSTLWATNPQQQLAYFAAKNWARLYAPDVILGVYSEDELVEQPVKDMGVVIEQPERPITTAEKAAQLPDYPQEKLEKFLPNWGKAISTGQQTAESIIRKINTKNNLTPEQVEQIKALEIVSEQQGE